jgi:hypothetical protein
MLKATHSRTTKRFPTRELPCGFGRTLMWCSMLMLLSLGIRAASAGECLITGPQYQLQSDTVEWQLKTRIGQSCIRGIRFRNVAGPVVKIISPPSFGKLAVLGPSFSYTAGTDVADKDSFSFEYRASFQAGAAPQLSTLCVHYRRSPNTESGRAELPQRGSCGGPTHRCAARGLRRQIRLQGAKSVDGIA